MSKKLSQLTAISTAQTGDIFYLVRGTGSYKISFDDLKTALSDISVEEGIIAFAGGGQASATILTANYNMVDTVASTSDSVKCDSALANKIKEIFNTSSNDMDLYPKIGERFKNGSSLMAVDAALTIAAGNGIKLVCYSDGIWRFN